MREINQQCCQLSANNLNILTINITTIIIFRKNIKSDFSFILQNHTYSLKGEYSFIYILFRRVVLLITVPKISAMRTHIYICIYKAFSVKKRPSELQLLNKQMKLYTQLPMCTLVPHESSLIFYS